MTTGRAQFDPAWRVALLGWLGCVLLEVSLYARPGPWGDPFLVEWRRYFWLSLYLELLGTWLVAGPFLLLWLALWKRELGPRWRLLNYALAAALAANLVLTALDHEVTRFLGTRIGLSFLGVYARAATLGDGLFQNLLLADRGGALFPPLLLVAVPAAFLGLALRILRKGPAARRPPYWLAIAIALVPLAAPLNGWAQATSAFRIRRIEPAVLALASDFRLGFEDMAAPPDLAALASEHRRRWLAESGDPGWRFADPELPYLRTPLEPAEPEPRRWNVIYLQLETLRGRDVGVLGGTRPSPTPFLDRLAQGRNSAVWTRGLSFGMPTINGLFATHCSVAPHSRRFITAFTSTRFDCLPEALRRRGYRVEMFNAGDTDWDNSTIWLKRWYDRLWRFPEARGRDRPVFRAAAGRIRALGRSGRPFFASLVSVSNHTPFNPPEPGFGSGEKARARQPNLATTRYTDDVVREFMESLSGEPWLDRTLFVIVGDHGFNLGEQEVPAGRTSLYREAIWIPIVVAGPHPRLAAGRRDGIATLLDVAPTVADLLGLREAAAWQGRSLVREGPPASLAFAVQGWRFAEDSGWTMVQPPGERPRLFDRNADWLQRSDRSRERPALAAAMAARAERARRLNDYLIRNDRVAPR